MTLRKSHLKLSLNVFCFKTHLGSSLTFSKGSLINDPISKIFLRHGNLWLYNCDFFIIMVIFCKMKMILLLKETATDIPSTTLSKLILNYGSGYTLRPCSHFAGTCPTKESFVAERPRFHIAPVLSTTQTLTILFCLKKWRRIRQKT